MRRNQGPGAYRPGDYLVVCDRTGKVVLRSQARKEWNGLLVRKESWEPRHPQEYVRGVQDDQAVTGRPWQDPETTSAKALADIASSSGSVAGGLYTSAALTNSNTVALWELDLGDTYNPASVSIDGLFWSSQPPEPVARGLFIETQKWSDSASWDRQPLPISQFDATTTAATNYTNAMTANEVRRIRLVATGGLGLGFTGTLSHGAIRVRLTQTQPFPEWTGPGTLWDQQTSWASELLWV